MDQRGQRHPIACGASALLAVVVIGACARPVPIVKVPKVPDVVRETPATEPPVPPGPAFYRHSVRLPGETLSLVAKWYTGSAARLREIARINPTLDPNRLAVGDVVSIPMAMITRDRPMPRTFLPAPAPPPARRAPPPPPDAEELFGPMDVPDLTDDDAFDLFPPVN
ncbi:hypothetical protein JCM14469_37210 [Desulfatiferula olefinivorans]